MPERAPTFTVSVDARPPERGDPGRCADRWSPRAAPLFAAARKIVERDAASFPLDVEVRCAVASAEPLPQHDGYDAVTAIIEVLADAGVLTDERQVMEEHTERRDGPPSYTVLIEPLRSAAETGSTTDGGAR